MLEQFTDAPHSAWLNALTQFGIRLIGAILIIFIGFRVNSKKQLSLELG